MIFYTYFMIKSTFINILSTIFLHYNYTSKIENLQKKRRAIF
nr:MAG TPA: hypothetical protein [Caudoviricetes sp.]